MVRDWAGSDDETGPQVRIEESSSNEIRAVRRFEDGDGLWSVGRLRQDLGWSA